MQLLLRTDENTVVTMESKNSSLEVGPGTNTNKTKYVVMFHRQNAGQNYKIKLANTHVQNT